MRRIDNVMTRVEVTIRWASHWWTIDQKLPGVRRRCARWSASFAAASDNAAAELVSPGRTGGSSSSHDTVVRGAAPRSTSAIHVSI